MRLLVTSFVTIVSFFQFANPAAASSGNSDWLSTYTCTATEEMPPPDKSVVKITFLKVGSEISVKAKSVNKDLNFQFGNGKLDGENTADKSSYDCSNDLSQSDNFYSFEYKCDRVITDLGGTKKVTSHIAARVSLTRGNAIAGLLCSRLSAGGSTCWKLSDCK